MDRQKHLMSLSPSYSHGAPRLRGEGNLVVKLARALQAQRPAGHHAAFEFDAASAALTAAYEAAAAAQDSAAEAPRR